MPILLTLHVFFSSLSPQYSACMSPSRSSDGSPWPLQTQHVSQASSSSSQGLSRKKRAQQPSRYARSSLHARQQIADQSGIGWHTFPISILFIHSSDPFSVSFFSDAAKARCENSDNSVISCWPTSNTRMNQGEFTQFVCTLSSSALSHTVPSVLNTHFPPSLREQPSTILCSVW